MNDLPVAVLDQIVRQQAEIDRLKAELEEASTIANDNYQVILKCNAQINGYKRQLDSFKESTESDWLRINALVEEQSSWSLKAVEQFNRADDLERQLDASQALLAEARAENERIGSVLGLQEYTKHIRQEAIKECLEFIDPITQIHVKQRFGLEG